MGEKQESFRCPSPNPLFISGGDEGSTVLSNYPMEMLHLSWGRQSCQPNCIAACCRWLWSSQRRVLFIYIPSMGVIKCQGLSRVDAMMTALVLLYFTNKSNVRCHTDWSWPMHVFLVGFTLDCSGSQRFSPAGVGLGKIPG